MPQYLRSGAALTMALAILTSARAAPPTYRIVDLGVPAGYQSSTGNDLNDKGQVVGMLAHIGLPENYRSYFVWSPELGMRIWDGEGKPMEPNPEGLNNRGKVAGSLQHKNGSPTDAFVATKGGLRKLGQLQPGGRGWANAINDAGVVVGQASVDERLHAFRWTPDGGMVDLNPEDADESYAPGINDQGAIVAWYWSRRLGRDAEGLYIAADGTSTRLDCLVPDERSHQCVAVAINNLDQVVGRSTFSEEIDGQQVSRQHAFLWSAATGSIDLTQGTPFADRRPQATGINDRMQVVGSMQADGGAHPTYWDRAEGWHDLVELIDPADPLLPRVRLVGSVDINRWGQVLVKGSVDGAEHALLLTPVR